MEVEFDDVKIDPCIVITEGAAGEQQHDERHQQQHAAGGREFFQDRPEKFSRDMQAAAAPGETVWRLGFDIARIEAVTGACFGFKLRPELRKLQALSDAPPEL